MVRDGASVPVAAFSASTRKVKVPALVGVPDSTPVLWFRLNPAGRLPDASLKVAAG
jgi:hypothetical protein